VGDPTTRSKRYMLHRSGPFTSKAGRSSSTFPAPAVEDRLSDRLPSCRCMAGLWLAYKLLSIVRADPLYHDRFGIVPPNALLSADHTKSTFLTLSSHAKIDWALYEGAKSDIPLYKAEGYTLDAYISHYYVMHPGRRQELSPMNNHPNRMTQNPQ
jgi:hypothetical protein